MIGSTAQKGANCFEEGKYLLKSSSARLKRKEMDEAKVKSDEDVLIPVSVR